MKIFRLLILFFSTTLSFSQVVEVSNTSQFLSELNAITAGTSSAIEIRLQENIYALTSEIILTSAHNGLTISGCGNVFLNGGVVLNSDDFVDYTTVSSGFVLANSAASSNIKVLDLVNAGFSASNLGAISHHGYGFSDNFSTPSMLWLDESKMDLSRWPNKEEVVTTSDLIIPTNWEDLRPKVLGAISYQEILETGTKKSLTDGIKFTINSARDAKISSWQFHKKSNEKIWMDGVVHSSWEWQYNKVKEISNSEIKMQYGSNSSFSIVTQNGRNVDSATKVSHFHFENIAEELDTEGEYFIDRDNMLLYFYPPTGWESKKLTLSVLNDDLISIKGATGIKIQNITLEAGLKNGIVITDSDNITVENCIIRNFNQWGVRIEGTENLVDNCELYNLGAGGVKLGIEKRTFHITKENNTVQKSIIHDFAWDQKSQVPGITLSGSGNNALQNEIYDGPHFAVKFRQSRGCVLEGNRIHDLPKYHHFDGGAVYLGLGINFQNRENIVRNNTLSRVPTNGVYLDNYTVGNFVEGNSFYDIGNSTDGANYAAIYNHGGGQNSYTDNIAIDCSVYIKTGSHIVKSGSSWKYLKSWFELVQSGQGFFKPSGAYYTDFVTEYSSSNLEGFIDFLSDLPKEVKEQLPFINSDSDWNSVKLDWDEKGYDAMKDDANSSGLSEWLQWRNYFQLRYQQSYVTNNLSMNTDTDKLSSGGNGKWGAKTLGDGAVFWEYSPYFELNANGNKIGYISLHTAEHNEALSNSETSSSFPNLVLNGEINEALYPVLNYSAGNLLNPISLNLQNRGDLNTVSFTDCQGDTVCSGIGLASFSFMEGESCDGTTKVNNYTVVSKDVDSEEYTIDLSAGTDSHIFSLFFLEDWDSTGSPNGPFDASVALMPDADFIEFVGEHNGFEISSINKMSSACWNWNRRVNVELKYTGTDYDAIHELELTFNPNNNLISKNGESYCSQTVNMFVKVNNPTLDTDSMILLKSLSYPNPVKDILTISNAEVIDNVEVYSIFGQKLKSLTFSSNKIYVDMSEFASGGYLLYVQTAQRDEYIRVIKQ